MPDVKISAFSEYFQDFHPSILIYGYNGTGKTTFAGTTGLKTLLLDCSDAGVMTLRKASNLRIIRVQSTMHYLDVMDKVNSLAEKVDLLVVDTLTGLQSMAIKEVKGRRGEMNMRKWGQVGSRVIECISETRMFKKDVIYLAQERRKTKDEGENTVQLISPSLTPGVREFLSSCVDWVGRMYIDDEKRKMSFLLTSYVEAKDRSSLFPKIIANPSYAPIRKRIMESIHV